MNSYDRDTQICDFEDYYPVQIYSFDDTDAPSFGVLIEQDPETSIGSISLEVTEIDQITVEQPSSLLLYQFGQRNKKNLAEYFYKNEWISELCPSRI